MRDPVKPRRPQSTPRLPKAEVQAVHHRRVRQQNRSEIAQDYVEAIADLIDSSGEARAVDVARRLGVSHVTVIQTVRRLQRDGWVTSQPYRSIFLTEKGRELALESRHRHTIVVAFLEAAGVPTRSALADAEGIEHHVSAETLAAFERFIAKTAAERDEKKPATP
jgi:DtxR family manganese transport transcriptional regulator